MKGTHATRTLDDHSRSKWSSSHHSSGSVYILGMPQSHYLLPNDLRDIPWSLTNSLTKGSLYTSRITFVHSRLSGVLGGLVMPLPLPSLNCSGRGEGRQS